MLIRFPADSDRAVWLTDEPEKAALIRHTEPVIGITGPEPENYSLWSGIFYLAESFEAVDETYADLVWCRFYGCPVTVVKTQEWCLREMEAADLPALRQMYQVRDIRRYLEHPTGKDESDEAWSMWFEAYCRYVYRIDEPAMWVLTDKDGTLLGRLGMERQTVCGIEGYFLGYALMPEARGKGLIAQAAKKLLSCIEERWGITEVWLACEKENQASIACAKRLGFQKYYEDQMFSVFFMSASIS